jgi:MFS transporter, SIT family, siderophore-iron:H+ symporter
VLTIFIVVAFNESIDSATRITNIFSFTSVLVGTGLGIIVRYVRYLKPLWVDVLFRIGRMLTICSIISGVILVIVAFGLLIRYRGGDDSSRSAIIGAQVVLGFGAG